MCGLVGLVQRFDPEAGVDLEPLAGVRAALAGWSPSAPEAAAALAAQTALLEPLSRALVGWGGLRVLREDAEARARVSRLARELNASAEAIDAHLADPDRAESGRAGEALARAAVAVRDVAWRLERDALPNLDATNALAGDEDPGPKGWFELWRINLILNQLERLEVRGRDSGGLGTLVQLEPPAFAQLSTALAAEGLDGELERRAAIPELRDGALLVARDEARVTVAFVHKVAEEVGELGANVRDLREKLSADRLFRRFLGAPAARVQVVAHTRWASNGIISEPNCHPVANDLVGDGPLEHLVLGVLNGDVDNFPSLADGWRGIPPACTTDAKIIPLEVARRAEDAPLREAFRAAVDGFQGSTAIAVIGSAAPDEVQLAVRGSGQAVYVGVVDGGGYLFASELYGVVELARRHYKLNGELGEVVHLAPGEGAAGLAVQGYDGSPRPLREEQLKVVPIATRDIDRGGHPHFFLKEISEGPRSVERTLRGKFLLEEVDGAHRARFRLGEDVIPAAVRAGLAPGAAAPIRRLFVIGQGTACVAGRAIADALGRLLRKRGIDVRGMPATDLSGFYLDDLGPDVLVIAVSQSGTTTDTNRTVDLARERGAHVIGIVNRRGSDLVDKSHGVLYTSDGRDVEMSVASTKAFYCQVVAGYLLGLALAELAESVSPDLLAARLLRLQDVSRCLRAVLEEARERIRLAAQLALRRRHWTVVGSGPLHEAAREIRIKLSELCYKSVSVDTIEDKKHIDLSSEPMILVCAAGLSGAAAADAVKEVAIFKAHAAIPIVICDRGETRFADYAAATIEVPASSPAMAVLLNTIVGHLFSYEAALAIDACARPLRRARAITEAALEALAGIAGEPSPAAVSSTLLHLQSALVPLARQVFATVERGEWDAALGADDTHRVVSALRLGMSHLSWRELRAGPAPPPPRAVLEHLLAALTGAIDALRRPIDAIKHQAKTVTVGISREQESTGPPPSLLLDALVEAGVAGEALADQDAAALAALSPALREALGVTRYRLEGLSPLGAPTASTRIVVEARTGVAAGIPSRANDGAPLRGTKRMIVRAPRVWVGHGQRDGRSLVLCPLYREGLVAGLGLIHVRFDDALDTRTRVRALKAVGRYEDLICAVTEGDLTWSDELLDRIPVVALLTYSSERLGALIGERAAEPWPGDGAPAPSVQLSTAEGGEG